MRPHAERPPEESAIARPLDQALAAARDAALGTRSGRLASYIPELESVDPELFALAVCTVDGERSVVGDADARVTIQSVSKPFVYAAALERFGPETVHARVGAEPTGDAFDSYLRLDDRGRPHNPMVNAGALATSALFVEDGPAEVHRILSAWAGRDLGPIDEAVRASEASTGFRNRAIVHLLRHHRCLAEPVDAVLDLYVRQCATRVGAGDLAVMAATLAAGGVSPVTGRRVLAPELVDPVLTVMATCGMYDHAGWFAVRVGLPAKSGVSGAMVAVAPGRMGLAAVSPRLGHRGESVRGVVAFERLAEDLGLHGFGARSPASAGRPERARSGRAIPDGALEAVRREVSALPDVAPAGYLPDESDPGSALALASCDLDGAVRSAGPGDRRFSLQAAGNPFLYALVADAVGSDEVHRHVGVEPAGHPFDSVRLGPHGRPANPFDNAGALAVAGLAPGGDRAARIEWLRRGVGAILGREDVQFDEAVWRAEERAGDRNRALAALLRSLELVEDPDTALAVYFASCSLAVSTVDLARAAALFARGGLDARGRDVVSPEVARDTVSLMSICGLHDETGRFAFEVGLPAKSGISGGLWAVVPGQAGLAVRSPGVDDHGTSVRGRAGLRRLSRRFGLGLFAVRAAAGEVELRSPWEGGGEVSAGRGRTGPSRRAVVASRMVAGLAGALLLGCRESPPEPTSPEVARTSEVAIERMETPAPSGAFAPELRVDGDGVFLTWIRTEEGESVVELVRWDPGSGWGPVRQIVRGSDHFSNWADRPGVVRAPDGALVAWWLAKLGDGTYAYGIRLRRSEDEGATWSDLGLLHDDASQTEHGFPAFVVDGPALRAFWLDGRATSDGGAMQLRTALVGPAGPEPSELLDARVCDCCSLDAGVVDDRLVVVYRDRSEAEVRDVSRVVRTVDGWTEPDPVSIDGWSIHGCPVNGPELAGGVVAWFTAADETPRVRIARVAMAPESSATPAGSDDRPGRIVDAGSPLGRVDLARGEGRAVWVSWLAAADSGDPEGASVRVRSFGEDGALGPEIELGRTSGRRRAGVPRLERVGDDLVAVWLEDRESGVAGLRAARWRAGHG